MVTRLDAAYDQAVFRVRQQVTGFTSRYWNGMGSWRDRDYRTFLRRAVPRVEAAQQRIADLTDAYIARLAVDEFGAMARGTVIRATTSSLRGVDAATVYHRPFASAYAALDSGKSVTAAVKAGADRLEQIVTSGMQLSKTHSARAAMGRSKFELYQRVLTGRENCALCVIASTQRYWRGDLAAIHPACDCGVKAFRGNPDRQVIDAGLLDRTHELIESKLAGTDRSARDLGLGKTVQYGDSERLADFTELILVREHDELGPVLTWRTDKFTSAADIDALAS